MVSLLKKKKILAASSGADGGLSAYQTLVLSHSPLAYWPCDDVVGSPTARDLVGTRHGVSSGAGLTFGVPGVVADSKAMTLDGALGNLAVSTFPSIATAHTIEVWEFRTTAPSELAVMLNRPGGSSGCFVFGSQPGFPTDHRILMNYTGFINSSSDPVLPLNDLWHHIAVTYDGSNVRHYVDGALTATYAMVMTDTSTALPLFIGQDASPRRVITMQDLAFYLRTLSPAEILSHYSLRIS